MYHAFRILEEACCTSMQDTFQCESPCKISLDMNFLMIVLWKVIFLLSTVITIPCLLVNSKFTFFRDIKELWNVNTCVLKIVLITFVLNYLLLVWDIYSDVGASVYHYLTGDIFYAITTIGVTFLPFTVRVIQEIIKICKFISFRI